MKYGIDLLSLGISDNAFAPVYKISDHIFARNRGGSFAVIPQRPITQLQIIIYYIDG